MDKIMSTSELTSYFNNDMKLNIEIFNCSIFLIGITFKSPNRVYRLK